jgi:protein TonB
VLLRREPPEEAPLFGSLSASDAGRARRLGLGLPFSFAVHFVVVAAAILVPIFTPVEMPERRDYIRALLYDPPPPPPAPLPKGSSLHPRPEPARPVTPDTTEKKPALTAPVEPVPQEAAALQAEAKTPESEQFGIPTGSESGVPEGMEGGVEGGEVGGVPGGVLGGVIGGTGTGPVPVLDYDRPPRALRQPKPEYPPEAFVKKVEGVVTVEILIDATGRVARVRVVRSIPLLDAAAVAAVRQWAFEPALRKGRPVATLAVCPVSFRIL